MADQWAEISEADKVQCAQEAEARNALGSPPLASEVTGFDPEAAR